MQIAVRKSFDFLGRAFLATTFAVAIPSKIFKFSIVVDAIENKGIPRNMAIFLLVGALACLICGVGCLVTDKYQRMGAYSLLIFIIPTTIIMHFYPFQSVAVFMNIGIIGGLVMVLTRSLKDDFSSKYTIEGFLEKLLEFIKIKLTINNYYK